MLRRTRRRARRFQSVELRLIEGDMCGLPLQDAIADLCLSYGGLHCVREPERALAEMARCLRPGGRLVGSTFLAQGSARQRMLLRGDDFGSIGTADDLRGWLRRCGLTEVSVDREDGLAVFGARRPS
jgi:ubiquinone/menaquinone biosynthesis C-methylase UbiE